MIRDCFGSAWLTAATRSDSSRQGAFDRAPLPHLRLARPGIDAGAWPVDHPVVDLVLLYRTMRENSVAAPVVKLLAENPHSDLYQASECVPILRIGSNATRLLELARPWPYSVPR